MKTEICQPKKENQTDSFFYEGDIATCVKPNGTRLILIATGDIRIRIGKEVYDNHSRDDAIIKHNLTDRRLVALEQDGELEWLNNNWFEVVWCPKGSDVMEFEIGEVAYSYDEGMQLLKDYYEDDIR